MTCRTYRCTDCGDEGDVEGPPIRTRQCPECGGARVPIRSPGDRLEMAEMMEQADAFIEAGPLFDVHNGAVTVGSLEAELDVLQEGAERARGNGQISGDFRHGMLVAVAALRRALEQAQGEADG